MIPRTLKLPKDKNLFLFGARNTGKSTLIRETFNAEKCLSIDLLDPLEEERFSRNPKELESIVSALPENVDYIILDEIQKIPKLLNIIHSLIEKTKKKNSL